MLTPTSILRSNSGVSLSVNLKVFFKMILQINIYEDLFAQSHQKRRWNKVLKDRLLIFEMNLDRWVFTIEIVSHHRCEFILSIHRGSRLQIVFRIGALKNIAIFRKKPTCVGVSF